MPTSIAALSPSPTPRQGANMPTIAEQNEGIRQAREARYLELWADVYEQVEYESRNGAGSIVAMKDAIRAELPYIVDTD